MRSFEVNIRFCQPRTFEGLLILVLTEKESTIFLLYDTACLSAPSSILILLTYNL